MTNENPVPRLTATPAPVVDARSYRNTIGLFATGVTIITTRDGDVVHGMTANAVSSVSLDPTLLLVCIDRQARMHDLIQRAGVFAVNVLAEDQEQLSGHFAGQGKTGPPPPGLSFDRGRGPDDSGAPTIHGCITALRCVIEQGYPGGDHTIFLGRIVEIRPGRLGARPLLFFGGRYRQLAEFDVVEPPGPDLWGDDAVQVYYHEWEAPPEVDRRRRD